MSAVLRNNAFGARHGHDGPEAAAWQKGRSRSGNPVFAQVLFLRRGGRKRDSNDSNVLRNSDLSASSNDSDTYRKYGFEPCPNGEWGEIAQTRMGSGFAAH